MVTKARQTKMGKNTMYTTDHTQSVGVVYGIEYWERCVCVW